MRRHGLGVVLLVCLQSTGCSSEFTDPTINQAQQRADAGTSDPQDGGGNEEPPPAAPEGCVAAVPVQARCDSQGWCLVPSGCFLMGSPASDPCRDADEVWHWVTLTRSFRIDAFEVTQRRFAEVLGYEPAEADACGPECPVTQVTWHQAAAYANALSVREQRPVCYACSGAGPTVSCSSLPRYTSPGGSIYACPGYRLPTEAEWEYAFRAGTTAASYAGELSSCYEADDTADRTGWYRQNAGDGPRPVGGKNPNGFGLFDMGGNIEEWVHDGYAAYPDRPVTDPEPAVIDDGRHQARGGSWYVFAKDLRAADRNRYPGTTRDGYEGFRVVRSEDQKP